MIPEGHSKFCVTCGADTDVVGCVVQYKIDEKTGKEKDVEVYCSPCNHAESMDRYAKTGVLRSRLTVHAAIYNVSARKEDKPWAKLYDQMNQSMEKIHKLIKVFDHKIWLPDLQAQVEATNSRGLSAKFGEHKMLVWSCAGRTLITLDNPTHQITLITATDEKTSRMGTQGIEATEEQALAILNQALESWPLKLVEDKQVSYL